MSVCASRRKICRLAAGIPFALPIYRLSAADSTAEPLCFIRLDTAAARHSLQADSLVLVDTRVTRFEGDGLYVYPDWGKPVVYEVRGDGRGGLEFFYPGSNKRLWRMNAGNPAAHFSGRAAGWLLPGQTPGPALANHFTELQVPSLPVS